MTQATDKTENAGKASNPAAVVTSENGQPLTLNDLSDKTISQARFEQSADAARRALEGKAQVDETGKGPTETLREIDVLIYRNDFATIPDTVYEHELRILQLIHGTEAVRVLGTYEVEVENFTVHDEFARLQRKYNSKEAGDPVSRVYGGGAEALAEAAGVDYEPGEARPIASSESQDNRPARKPVGPKPKAAAKKR